MKRLATILTILATAFSLNACATRTGNTVLGAAAGAGVGSAVTGGSTAGAIGGAAVGGVLGHELSK
jgi:osmotically inducible lipoprotein OsmB